MVFWALKWLGHEDVRLLPVNYLKALPEDMLTSKIQHWSDRNAGEGLGLNWVRTIVEHLHQGRIRAENLDRAGARIILEFPPVTAERVGEAAERPSETTRGECLDANG